MANERIGKGILEVGFDPKQVEAAGKEQLLPSAKRVAGDITSVFAAVKIGGFAKDGIEELKQAQTVSAQTAVVLRNLGSAAGTSVDEVDALSKSMLQQSGVDDELAKSAENTLLRLGVQGDAFRRATQDANDLAQSFGDMGSDAELLGKALAHPEQAARLLKPAIGGLTDAQLASIKAFQDHGDAAGAEGVILDAVEAKVKGAAAAFGETLPGQVKIAEESMKNMKAELVGGAAPALVFGAKAVTFLTDEFDKLPDSAQAAVGGVVLVGGATTAVARPIGDVVRLYSQWKDRSEEVTAATSELAAAESSEAAASAAGAAASASATAVTAASAAASNEAAAAALRRVVSNEQIVFSDAAVAAAEQAAFDAQMQRLVSNDALIASDAELAAAEAAAAADTAAYAASVGLSGTATLGLGGVLALAAAGAGTAIGVYSALSDVWSKNTKGVDDYTKALEANTGVQDENVDAVTANKVQQSGAADIARQAGVSFRSLFDSVRSGNEDWGAAERAIGSWSKGAGLASVQGHDLADALRSAGLDQSEFGRQLIAGAEAGKINGEQADKLLHNMEGLHNGYQDATAAASDNKEVTDAVASATDDMGESSEEAAAKIDALAKAQQGAAGLIDDLSAAMDRQYEAGLKNTDQLSNYEGTVDDLVKSLSGDPDKVSGLQDAIADGNDKVASSAQDVADAQHKLDELRSGGKATADQLAAAERRVTDAQKQHDRAIRDLTKTQQDLSDAQADGVFTLDVTTEKGRENVKAAEDTGRAIKDLIVQRFKDTGSVQSAIETGNEYVQNLKDQLAAAGYNEDQISQMIDVMNLTPQDITTTFTNNAASQQLVIGEYLKLLDDIPPKQQHLIETYIDMEKYNEAKTLLDFLTGNYTDVNLAVTVAGQPHRAAGGPVGPSESFVGAEQGYEILWKNGMYQAPPQGGYVMSHAQSAAFLAGMAAPSVNAAGININGPINVTGKDAPSALEQLPAVLKQGILSAQMVSS